MDALLRDAGALDVIVTDSVVEALALENRLIKQRNPRYNILLRDDKTYPYLQLTTTERAPRVLVARRVLRDGNVYAGPFMPASIARRTMELTHRLFGIRSCNEIIDGKPYGSILQIQPRASPSLVVTITHIGVDPSLSVGSPVAAGTSRIGLINDFSGVERQALAAHTKDTGNHVTIEVQPSSSATP